MKMNKFCQGGPIFTVKKLCRGVTTLVTTFLKLKSCRCVMTLIKISLI